MMLVLLRVIALLIVVCVALSIAVVRVPIEMLALMLRRFDSWLAVRINEVFTP